MPFKVIQGHRFWHQKKSSYLYDFLLVINTNLPSILHGFQVMADYWVIGQIFAGERGVPHFNALAGGDTLSILA